MAEIPVLLLAAGGSSRMGQAKQLLPWGNTTLIEHQIITLEKTGNPLSVVLGANSNMIIPVIKNYRINIIINEGWEQGMGSSISYGIGQIIKNFPDANGVLITLLDQPLITSAYLKMMLDAFKPGDQQILVTQSDTGWRGVPVLFDKFYFKYLLKLSHDEGAKKIINRFEEKVITLKCNDLTDDIDTPQAYKLLLDKYISQSGL